MRPSRVFRLIFRILILLLTTSVTVVTILGGLSAYSILDPQAGNIGIDEGNIDYNIVINFTTGDLNDFNFTLPFNITNAGYFELEDLNITFEIGLRYEHINLTIAGQNDTVTVDFFKKTQTFDNIPQGQTLYDNFTGDIVDVLSFPNALTQINWYRTPSPDLELFANFTIGLTYSIGLHSLEFGIYDIPIGGFSLP